MTKEVVQEEISSLTSRHPFSPFRILLISGNAYSYDEKQAMTFLSWGIYISMHMTEWASFSYESIIGFDSLLEYDPNPESPAT